MILSIGVDKDIEDFQEKLYSYDTTIRSIKKLTFVIQYCDKTNYEYPRGNKEY